MATPGTSEIGRNVGRYVLFEEIAHGGMATVHIGRLRGSGGFKRTVAIKRLHASFARDPDFVARFLEEAHLAARIQHPNVVSVLDVVAEAGELFLVMEYVHGDSLSNLLLSARRKGDLPSPAIVAQIMTGVLYGLHAAHEARSDRGVALDMVHRDVSPQNIIVGTEGLSRVLDFGVAKAVQAGKTVTKEGVVKGKVAYMAPEQLDTDIAIDRRADVYAVAVVLWEALAGQALYEDLTLPMLIARVLTEDPPLPSTLAPDLPPGIDAVVMKGLARNRDDRYSTAMDMARAIENVIPPVPNREVSEWVQRVVDEALRSRADIVSKVEKLSIPPAEASEGMPESMRGVPPIPVDGSARMSREISGTSVITADLRSLGVIPSSPRGWVLGLVAAAIVLVLVVLFFAWRALAPPAKVAASVASTTPSSPASPPASGSAIVPATAATPTESAAPTATVVTPVPSTTTAPTASATPLATASATAHPRFVPPPPARNCNPPWTIDARGVRSLKRECL